MVDVILISKPNFDMPAFLSLASEMLGRSLSRNADAANLKDQPHLLACLAAFRDPQAGVSIKSCRDVYDLLHYGCLIASDEQDMSLILEILGGMPFALVETKMRSVQAAIIVGTFHRWKYAVLRGCRQDQPDSVRVCFDKIYLQFQNLGLSDAFGRLTKRTLPDRTFYLEDQR